jgi:hypothetical protein
MTVATDIRLADIDAALADSGLTYADLTTYRERVAKGAAVLDAEVPGWADRIDLDSLELRNTNQCVLGQLFDRPVTVPRWQQRGYDSAEAMVRDNFSIAWATEPICRANYEAGKLVLGKAMGLTEQAEVSDLTVAHGFDDLRSSWALLDLLWASEVRARQSAEVAA